MLRLSFVAIFYIPPEYRFVILVQIVYVINITLLRRYRLWWTFNETPGKHRVIQMFSGQLLGSVTHPVQIDRA